MAQTANSSPENKRYNDEVLLLDGLYEFHPEFFDQLNEEERHLLQAYYLTDQDVPENIFVYRAELLRQRPELEPGAQAVLAKVCALANIKGRKT